MENINFYNKEFHKFKREFYRNLSEDQNRICNRMIDEDIMNICMPTGTGKSYIIYADMLEYLQSPSLDVFTIATHRLMLNSQHFGDLFNLLNSVVGGIGYIFVGSQNIDLASLQENVEFNQKLKDQNLRYEEIISCTTSSKKINELVSEHKSKNRDVIIISTYNSLDRLKDVNIHTLYCDEAHLLATEKMSSEFKENYKKIKKNIYRSYFFTATPKDVTEDEEDSFLMNNKEIFGIRDGLTFKESVQKGYIVEPIIHLATPENYVSEEKFQSTENYVDFILSSFEEHDNWLNNVSFSNNEIDPKLLVKCPSVEIIYKVFNKLNELRKNGDERLKNINIFAGFSKNDNIQTNDTHFFNDQTIDDRNDFLKEMKSLKYNEKAIILHYDILSEGINVPGITGVMFLSDILPTISKLLQNIGRSTRLHKLDRDRLLKKEIIVSDKEKWVKPYCAIILPVTSHDSENRNKNIAKTVKRLRDEYEFNVTFINHGEDISESDNDEQDVDRNKVNKKEKNTIIENIIHEIENLDKKEKNNDKKEELKKKIKENPENEMNLLLEFMNK